MRIGVIASLITHLMVVAWILLSFVEEKPATPEAIPVELVPTVPPAPETAPKHPPSDAARPETADSKTTAAPPSPPPSPPAPPPSAPPETKPPPPNDARPEPRGDPPPTSPDKIAPDLEFAGIAALLDRDLSGPGSSALATVGEASSGRATTIKQAVLDALGAQARRCWDIPRQR